MKKSKMLTVRKLVLYVGPVRFETLKSQHMQNKHGVSSLFKWCERHFESRQHQHLLPQLNQGEGERQEGKHQL